MKYLSVIGFIITLAWTWNVIHGEVAVPFETHAAIQNKLAEMIETTLKAKRPNISTVSMDKIWTETTVDGKLKDHFIYSFEETTTEGNSTTQIEGEGFLQKQADDDSGFDRWMLTDVKTNAKGLVFDDGLVISPE